MVRCFIFRSFSSPTSRPRAAVDADDIEISEVARCEPRRRRIRADVMPAHVDIENQRLMLSPPPDVAADRFADAARRRVGTIVHAVRPRRTRTDRRRTLKHFQTAVDSGRIRVGPLPGQITDDIGLPVLFGRIPGPGGRIVAVITGIHRRRGVKLLQVIDARDRLGALPRLLQRRQQHRGQDRDDRNDDQQFDQGECSAFSFHFLAIPLFRI